MKQTKLEITVGAFVIVGFAAIAYLALKIGAGLLVGTDTYVVTARFEDAAGLGNGRKVSLSGVTVGKVESVRLDPDNYGALVTLWVRSDVKLPADTVVSIRTNGLLGDKFVSLRPGVSKELVKPGGALARTESATDIETALSQFMGGSSDGAASGENSYVLHARFNNIAGITQGSRVTISGITVGTVEGVRLNTDDFSAVVDMRLRADVKLPVDSIVSVRSASLIGGKLLSIQLGGDPEIAKAGDTLIETESTVDLESLISRVAFGSMNKKDEKETTPAP